MGPQTTPSPPHAHTHAHTQIYATSGKASGTCDIFPFSLSRCPVLSDLHELCVCVCWTLAFPAGRGSHLDRSLYVPCWGKGGRAGAIYREGTPPRVVERKGLSNEDRLLGWVGEWGVGGVGGEPMFLCLCVGPLCIDGKFFKCILSDTPRPPAQPPPSPPPTSNLHELADRIHLCSLADWLSCSFTA